MRKTDKRQSPGARSLRRRPMLARTNRGKQTQAERVFKKGNPGWTVVQPWTAPLAPQFNKAEPMLAGKFDAVGPLGNKRNVWVRVYEDGIRIF